MNTSTPIFSYTTVRGHNLPAPSMNEEMKRSHWSFIIFFLAAFFLIQGCTGVKTFPTIARAGDTVSVMIGGTEKARKDTIAVTLTDIDGTNWDLQSLGLVRSVFNLRADGRAEGQHYSSYLESYISWSQGHEPVQTVLVADLPTGLPVGAAQLTISTGVDDNSSGTLDPFTINVEIIAGVGSSNNFKRKDGGVVDFGRLEPAPHAKITFGNSTETIGAASLVVDFDETVLNPDDINVYVPESAVRGTFLSAGAFGKTQRMVYWRQDGLQLYLDVIAPQGIEANYLQLFVMHPKNLTGPANLTLTSATIYDVNGNEIIVPSSLEYFP